MIHKAWCSIEEVPYYFSRSCIKFQGHTGWKIDDLDQIWARLLGWSQLSNPSDLPCCCWPGGSVGNVVGRLCAKGVLFHYVSEIPKINSAHHQAKIFAYVLCVLPADFMLCICTYLMFFSSQKHHINTSLRVVSLAQGKSRDYHPDL